VHVKRGEDAVIEDLALIGNCQISALVERSGSLVWCCLPRFDSEPVFSRLVDPGHGGHFEVTAAEGAKGQQRYIENTNVLETVFECRDGSFRVVDFAPRFWLHGRIFRPRQILRIVEPLKGLPRIRIRCTPKLGWSRATPASLQGSNHIAFEGFEGPLRLTTDLPLSHLEGTPLALTGRRHLALTWGTPIEEPLQPLCDRFLTETVRYWQRWVKHSNIPPHYQREVIRSALSLKLHCFEDTGAIVASMTGGLQGGLEGEEETADDRFCWLQDASGALDAFRLLGHFEEREHFVEYLLNVASSAEDLKLAPFYRIDGRQVDEDGVWESGGLPEDGSSCASLSLESDLASMICGEMVLALAPGFMDHRFNGEISAATRALIERLARKAIGSFPAGDRDGACACPGGARTLPSLMSWVAADRMARVALHDAPWLHREFAAAAAHMRREIIDHAWNPDRGAFVSRFGGSDLDPALLRMAPLRFLPADDPRLCATIDAIGKLVGDEPFGMVFDGTSGPGRVPSVAAAFRLVEALAAIGRMEDARSALLRAYVAFSPLALLSADFDTAALRMWGNFPHARSHVEFIRAAFAASESWADLV
jgi:GH15 family glucan-1,4-alpha-glucosidase